MSDCLFCKIIKGEIPSTKIYEDKNVFAFKDIQPNAKEHYLFVSKNHTADINDLVNKHPEDLNHIFKAIDIVSKEKHLTKEGYRVVTNVGVNGGQTVFHTHFHVLGGEKLKGFGA